MEINILNSNKNEVHDSESIRQLEFIEQAKEKVAKREQITAIRPNTPCIHTSTNSRESQILFYKDITKIH